MIRLATLTDLTRIHEVYALAKETMLKSGNRNQWLGGYPSQNLLIDDIQRKQLYVLEYNNQIEAVFALILGVDATYLKIHEGKWISGEPYGTIHRLASSGKVRHVLEKAVVYSLDIIPHLRIDTHEDNAIMRHLLAVLQFQYCGIIYLKDGSPRLAYEYIRR